MEQNKILRELIISLVNNPDIKVDMTAGGYTEFKNNAPLQLYYGCKAYGGPNADGSYTPTTPVPCVKAGIVEFHGVLSNENADKLVEILSNSEYQSIEAPDFNHLKFTPKVQVGSSNGCITIVYTEGTEFWNIIEDLLRRNIRVHNPSSYNKWHDY